MAVVFAGDPLDEYLTAANGDDGPPDAIEESFVGSGGRSAGFAPGSETAIPTREKLPLEIMAVIEEHLEKLMSTRLAVDGPVGRSYPKNRGVRGLLASRSNLSYAPALLGAAGAASVALAMFARRISVLGLVSRAALGAVASAGVFWYRSYGDRGMRARSSIGSYLRAVEYFDSAISGGVARLRRLERMLATLAQTGPADDAAPFFLDAPTKWLVGNMPAAAETLGKLLLRTSMSATDASDGASPLHPRRGATDLEIADDHAVLCRQLHLTVLRDLATALERASPGTADSLVSDVAPAFEAAGTKLRYMADEFSRTLDAACSIDVGSPPATDGQESDDDPGIGRNASPQFASPSRHRLHGAIAGADRALSSLRDGLLAVSHAVPGGPSADPAPLADKLAADAAVLRDCVGSVVRLLSPAGQPDADARGQRTAASEDVADAGQAEPIAPMRLDFRDELSAAGAVFEDSPSAGSADSAPDRPRLTRAERIVQQRLQREEEARRREAREQADQLLRELKGVLALQGERVPQ
ncbi:hypothetical protein DFJ74DRAFT_767560 [Hyaloraphidium curvatum]|nr:hypothetical protein DFJ74DRAFT_767560 [Hyaloraphidium curvatum]